MTGYCFLDTANAEARCTDMVTVVSVSACLSVAGSSCNSLCSYS